VSRRSWTSLLLLAAIWGASYLFIKIGLRDLSPSAVAFLRVLLAALVLLALAASRGALAGMRRHLGVVVLVAVVQTAGPFLLIALGEQEISSSLAGILVASAPIFTVILAVWVDHEERATGLRLLGVGAGFAGVVVLLGLDLGGSGAAVLGGLAVVLAGLGYAVGGFVVKHRLREVAPLGLAAAVMVASSALLAPAAIVSAPSQMPAIGPVAAVTALGILGTGIAFAIFYQLISEVGPARSLLVAYIAPAFAIFYGAVLLDEAVTAATIAGVVLIVGGSWLAAEGRLPRRSVASAGIPAPAPEPPAPRGTSDGRYRSGGASAPRSSSRAARRPRIR
jgi:drug/metabolite transporter (DMT)-like permease